MKSYTWHELETPGKFDKKLSFVSDEMLIIGCDVGSEAHYVRAIDTRGRELSKTAFPFSNSSEGFQSMKTWSTELAVQNEKHQIVLGLEPTGHYWFCLASWLIANGISVVQVNPYAVKQIKEVEDNSQSKDDRKDPKLIANLVKDGNFGMPYLLEGLYAEIRRLSMFRDQLQGDRIRNFNRLHREMKIYFPEYKDAFGKVDGTFAAWNFCKQHRFRKIFCSLSLVACSSGKHQGQTKSSHRGRKRLRYWLFQAAKSAVCHAEEFKALHVYYTTRSENPLKKMQSLIVIACKLLRLIYTILKKGVTYAPEKMLGDIVRRKQETAQAA